MTYKENLLTYIIDWLLTYIDHSSFFIRSGHTTAIVTVQGVSKIIRISLIVGNISKEVLTFMNLLQNE
jgi:hypothetical protein